MSRTSFLVAAIGLLAAAGLLVTAIDRDTSPQTLSTDSTPAPEADAAEAGSVEPGTATGSTTTAAPVEVAAPENLGPARSLDNLDGWLQTEATSLDDFDGQVKIVQFWTFGCYNCTNTIPHLQDIYATHEQNGLEIIGVHAPEFSHEKDPTAIAEAATRLGVTWPIALDTDKTNFRAWQGSRRFWPRTFVIDANGDVRFDHIGEGRYDELEATVASLLATGGA